MAILESAELIDDKPETEAERQRRLHETAVDLAILLHGLPYRDTNGKSHWRLPGSVSRPQVMPNYYAGATDCPAFVVEVAMANGDNELLASIPGDSSGDQ